MKISRHCILPSLGIAALLLLVGCGRLANVQNSPEPAEAILLNDAGTDETAASDLDSILDADLKVTKPWNIAFVSKETQFSIPLQANEVYWHSAWQGVQETAQELGVKAEYHAVEQEVCSVHEECIIPQIHLVNALIEQGEVEGIVIGPIDSFRLSAVVEKAIESGIPVVAIDTPVDTEKILSLVLMDSYQGGEKIGEWVVQKLDGEGQVLILTGPKSDQNSIERHRGMLTGLDGGDITVLDTQVADWLEGRAQEITEDWLQEFPQIDAIMSVNDPMALGAINAVKAAKREILITGYDAIPPAIDAIRAGELAVTLDQAPQQQAEIATKLLIQHLEEQSTFPPIVFVPDIKLISQQTLSQD